MRLWLPHHPDEGVEEALPPSFFHAPRLFPEDVNEAALDQQTLARESRKSVVPGSNTQPGTSDKDDRQVRPSSNRRRSRSPSPGPSGSGTCHISTTREGHTSRSRKREELLPGG